MVSQGNIIVLYVLDHPIKDGLHLLGVGGLAGGKAVHELRDLPERTFIAPLVAKLDVVDVDIRLLQSGGAGGSWQGLRQPGQDRVFGHIAHIDLGGGGRDGQTQTHHKGQRKG